MQASTTIIEEEEPPPCLPPRIFPGTPYSGAPHPAGLPNGYYTGPPMQPKPEQTTYCNGSISNIKPHHNGHLKNPVKPPVPANKPLPPSRPRGVHDDAYNLNSYPNGSITTHISDQDGFRISRVPIDRNSTNGYQMNHIKTTVFNNSDHQTSNTQDPLHKYKLMNGNNNANMSIDEKSLQRSNIIMTVNDMENSNAKDQSNRLSYPNMNTSSDGERINNFINKNNVISSGTVNNLVSRLNNQNPTNPGRNYGHQPTFPTDLTKKPSEKENNVRNGRDEVSTEL